jgi:hypothetical protein
MFPVVFTQVGDAGFRRASQMLYFVKRGKTGFGLCFANKLLQGKTDNIRTFTVQAMGD